MHTFRYVKATSLKHAGELLAANADAKLLAGGMTLIPTMKARLAQPSHLIDIAGIAELSGIEAKDGKLSIGAATKHVDVSRSAVAPSAARSPTTIRRRIIRRQRCRWVQRL